MQEQIVFNKETAESLIISIAGIKSDLRKTKLMLIGFVSLFLICLMSFSGWYYLRYSSHFVKFISEGETKTLIGVKNAGRIQADTDERTGETIIEVYHAKK